MPATKLAKLKLILFFSISLTLLNIVAIHSAAYAAQINWQNKKYNHYAQKEDIKNVLTDFFASQGIGVVCSKEVTGSVSGNFKEKNPRAFFKYITDAYNLVWYYDGAAVYVYSAHEVTSKILNPRYLNMKKFKQHLIDLDMYDPKFAMRMIEQERIIYISGPKRYVELIGEMVSQLDAKAMAHGGMDDVIKIFPLKHAWADDKTMQFRDDDMVIPGVVTMLNNLIAGTTRPSQVINNHKAELAAPLNKLRGQGLRKDRPNQGNSGGAGPTAHQGQQQQNTSDRQSGNIEPHQTPNLSRQNPGSIQADTRQNAVVVRDREEKMPYYAKIIELLDAPVNLVEIRATIMDINRDNLHDLGIQWEWLYTNDDGEKRAKGGLNTGNLHRFKQEGKSEKGTGLQLPTGNGLNIATILGDTTDFFLAKVNALQDKGHAKILSRPSVLTLNNIEAQLEHSRTFYVRLEGEREVDLYDINSGVVLRVTPHIIEEKDAPPMVKLAIQIEDGDVSGEKVDDIPVVIRSKVNTQAVVGQKESLLIGGYKKEANSNRRQGIPCLGDVPFLGWLFKRNSNFVQDSERLFLITPTVVPYGASNHTAAQRKIPQLKMTDEDKPTKLDTENITDPPKKENVTPPGLSTGKSQNEKTKDQKDK